MTRFNERSISIIVVDDQSAIREMINSVLQAEGYDVRAYENGQDCLIAFKEEPADIVITDMQMTGIDGLMVLRRIKELSPSTEVILITGYANKNVAIEALRAGAYDFFEKPIYGRELIETIKRTTRYQALLRERDTLVERLSLMSLKEAEYWKIDSIVGESETLQKILRDINLLQSAGSVSVLITGESGTGKELVARAIHFGSSRASGPFVTVNCSAIPGELAESLLFGHVRGAFTGATTNRPGYFELAHGGTLFLDEISDMPLEIQAKLLRVLEDRSILAVGGTIEKHVNIRILAATNAEIHTRIMDGTFRQDLYFRIAQFTVIVPPLRDRKGDVLLLADHFLNTFAIEMGMKPPKLSDRASIVLESYSFPGNVRELKNIIERALIESGGATIEPEHLHFIPFDSPESLPQSNPDELPFEFPLNLQEAEARLIKRALNQTDENVSAAARLLGINRTKLYRKMEQHHITRKMQRDKRRNQVPHP